MFSREEAGFAVRFRDEMSQNRITGVFCLPYEKMIFEVMDSLNYPQHSINSPSCGFTKLKRDKWQWQAPGEVGLYKAEIVRADLSASIILHIFVMVPYSRLKGEYLNGYRIGRYPKVAPKLLPIYKPPKGFIEVTPESEETLISPHFRLGQFICKQNGNYPKYVVLKERLILKLEHILEMVNEKGYACNTFNILSGYRTPYYNKRIGNVKYSRHIYGGAADIFIDENPKDDMMDDLNGDGVIDWRDAETLYRIIDDKYGKPSYMPFVGGLGRYKKTTAHGPFVHVDVRGRRARWGT
jgi:hypothetical protein